MRTVTVDAKAAAIGKEVDLVVEDLAAARVE
jgi:hypothetical protein